MNLYYDTISDLLLTILRQLIKAEELLPFRLVGGTALSLQLGHRQSVDIDLFTDYEYQSIDFEAIDVFLKRTFNYVNSPSGKNVAIGKSYYIGSSAMECIKLDLFYTDKFIQPYIEIDGLRMATVEEITAMKVDIITRGGRKKDFWDIHEIAEIIPFKKMIELHQERYPYTHDGKELITQFSNFQVADIEFDPICKKGKYWEIIKLDILDMLRKTD